jgi:methionyl-tRNA formyltransferase
MPKHFRFYLKKFVKANSAMKLVFIGCVHFSFSALSHLLSLNNQGMEVAGIVTREKSSFNADFVSLVPLAAEYDIPYFIVRGSDQSEMFDWLKNLSPDVIYCFGWSYLLKEQVLKFPKLGVVGYHPAALPKNRGRHPIIWALALGLPETASTFFFMDEGADSGDILSQKHLSILESDDAFTLYQKLINTACIQIGEFTPQIVDRSFKRVPQDHSQASYWRKRGKDDGKIDWRMSARCIHNLVRALTRPYVGAHFVRGDTDVKVWKAELVKEEPRRYENIEPGKILKIEGHQITVKCGDGLLRLMDHNLSLPLKVGDYL